MIKPKSTACGRTLKLPYATVGYKSTAPAGYARRKRCRAAKVSVRSDRALAWAKAFLAYQVKTGYRMPNGALTSTPVYPKTGSNPWETALMWVCLIAFIAALKVLLK